MLFYEHSETIDTDYFRNREKYASRNVYISENLPTSKEVPISFVTRCMNRLHDLKLTLPKNIEDNKSYKNLEFVILDYNSTDGLGEWIQKEMMHHVLSGRVSYYRTTEPQFFQPNHSQNLTFRLASNSLVANIDSDNYTHEGYAQCLNRCCSVADERILIVPANFLLAGSKRLFLKGRFAVYKKDAEMLGGFDEELDEGFGNDDISFVLRAMLAGFQIVRYNSRYTEDRLPTSDEERVSLVKNKSFKQIRDKNGIITWNKLGKGIVTVNRNTHWGKARLIKNFKEELFT